MFRYTKVNEILAIIAQPIPPIDAGSENEEGDVVTDANQTETEKEVKNDQNESQPEAASATPVQVVQLHSVAIEEVDKLYNLGLSNKLATIAEDSSEWLKLAQVHEVAKDWNGQVQAAFQALKALASNRKVGKHGGIKSLEETHRIERENAVNNLHILLAKYHNKSPPKPEKSEKSGEDSTKETAVGEDADVNMEESGTGNTDLKTPEELKEIEEKRRILCHLHLRLANKLHTRLETIGQNFEVAMAVCLSSLSLSLFLCVCVCLYIYIYIYIYLY